MSTKIVIFYLAPAFEWWRPLGSNEQFCFGDYSCIVSMVTMGGLASVSIRLGPGILDSGRDPLIQHWQMSWYLYSYFSY